MNDPFRILPQHTARELAALRESIKADGLKQPIVVDTENNIIDGHARRDICKELGIDWMQPKAEVRTNLSDVQKRALALTLNLARRSTHPTRDQRQQYAEILLQANPASSDKCIAQLVGVDRSTICRLRAELVQANKIEPQAETIGTDGKKRSVSSDKRKKSATYYVRGQAEYDNIAPYAIKLQDQLDGFQRFPHRFRSKAQRREAMALIGMTDKKPLHPTIKLHHCDFRNLKIADCSVDLIATDVVWSATAAEDWKALGELAARWLKPNGIFVTLIGQGVLDKAFEAFKSLQFVWQFVSIMEPPRRAVMHTVVEGYRPALVFCKPGEPLPSLNCVLDRLPSAKAEKNFHDWQQSLPMIEELIRRLMPQGGKLVLDPQMGTGTAAVACRNLGLNFVGCDIDEYAYNTAHFRVTHEHKESKKSA